MDECKNIEDQLEGKDEKLEELHSSFEKNLVFLGVTDVEDML